ncbi:MAG: hypothetical protein FJX62_11400 [Alphaproteobacteria bacterium]|nr:hypothetical protein [Alphaproteobacteria bacterium]
MSLPQIIGWSAAFFCLLFSAQVANAFARRNPRLFTVMALLACNWALLLAFYGAAPGTNRSLIVAAIGGFLLIYVGGLLLLEAQNRKDREHANEILPWQIIGLYLLLLIATPSVPRVAGRDLSGINSAQMELVVLMLMDLAGMASIIFGSMKLFGWRTSLPTALCLVIYAALEVAYIPHIWPDPSHPTMPAHYAYSFAGIKVAFVIFFGIAVAYDAMSDRDRAEGPWHWLMLLMRWRNAIAQRQASLE